LTFDNPEIAKKALSKNGIEVLGRTMRVEVPIERTSSRKRESTFTRPISTKPPGCKTLFLGNLSYDIEDKNIYELLADCGEIKQIRWVTDKQTNEFKRCGFVEFYDEESTTKAIAHNGETILGRSIRLDYSTTRENTSQGNREW